jgi:hypothetical protein
MHPGANPQNDTTHDYDYGRSAGHYEATIRAGVLAVEFTRQAEKYEAEEQVQA